MQAEDAKVHAEEQRVLSVRAQEEAQKAQGSVSALQLQVTEAEASLAAASAAWEAERGVLEAAAELASADEVERRVQAGVAGWAGLNSTHMPIMSLPF